MAIKAGTPYFDLLIPLSDIIKIFVFLTLTAFSASLHILFIAVTREIFLSKVISTV